MSKLRVRGTLVTVVLFTAVAVSPTVLQVPGSKKASRQAPACEFGSTGVLMADGTDPWPPPPTPIPWSSQSA